MKNFYFTYGSSESYPFQGGWTTIEAATKALAIKVFRLYHPDIRENCLNCCDVYSAEYFEKTEMFIKNNNCGSSEQERIRVCCDNDGNILSVNLLEKVELTFEELQSRFTEVESNNKPHLTGYITFTADSFSEEYSEIARTYKFSSDNKLFNGKFSISLFGSCLDGTDIGVRLDQYMSKFHGGPDGWKVENCYYYKNKEL